MAGAAGSQQCGAGLTLRGRRWRGRQDRKPVAWEGWGGRQKGPNLPPRTRIATAPVSAWIPYETDPGHGQRGHRSVWMTQQSAP